MHQVNPGEKLVCGIHAGQVLAGESHEVGQTGASRKKHRIEVREFFYRYTPSDQVVRFQVNAQEITVSISDLTISFGSRNEGIPYKRTPPAACSDSNRVT